LLRYFGDHLEEPCGNCDTCLNPPKTWDGTVAVQKALSCVFRTGQRFGVTYLIDVLRGVENERIIRQGHNRVSTFGIGQDLSAAEWKTVFRQLVANGFLRADPEGFGSLQLTESCRPLLRGERKTELRLDPVQTKAAKRSGITRRRPTTENIADPAGWEALRARRKELADQQGVPPYVIFHDATLMEMLERKPQNLDELSTINGVGAAKLDKYGEAFLEVVRCISVR
jgi:ATP-dependent DNA helicase RecQ